MKLKGLLIVLVIFGFAALSAQWAQGGSVKADFSNAVDAEEFAAAAAARGQGKGAQVTHNKDGSTTVSLPEVATEMMDETAMDAIAEHANAIEITECPAGFATECEVDALLIVDALVAELAALGAGTSGGQSFNDCTGVQEAVTLQAIARDEIDPVTGNTLRVTTSCTFFATTPPGCFKETRDQTGGLIGREVGLACPDGCALAVDLAIGLSCPEGAR